MVTWFKFKFPIRRIISRFYELFTAVVKIDSMRTHYL